MGREPPAPRGKPDAALIEQSLTAPDAFAAIFDRHFHAIYAYLARRVGSARAEDLAASTFTVAFERRRRFRPEADSARPWLFGIASNLLRNDWRAERRALAALVRAGESVLRQPCDEGEAMDRLGGVLAELDPGQRDVLLLYAWEDLSYEEIATALDVPVGTVRSRLARARAHIRERLNRAGGSEAAAWEVSG